MKAIRLGLVLGASLFLSSQTNAQSTPPGGVSSGLILWLDASDVNANGTSPANNSALTTWKDKSGQGHDATSFSVNAGTFKANEINGLPTVTFTRIDDADGTGFTVPGVDIRAITHPQVTIFTVYRQGNNFPSQQQAVWGDDNGDWDRFFFTKFGTSTTTGGVSFGPLGSTTVASVTNAGAVGVTQLLTAIYNGSVVGSTNSGPVNGSDIYFNGRVVTTFSDNTDPSAAQTALKIGLDGDDNYFDGEIAEMIVYNRKLTDCEIEDVNHYLSQKYGTGYDVANQYTWPTPFTDVKGVGNFSTTCVTNVINSASSSIATLANPSVQTINNNMTFANDAGGFAVSTDVPTGYAARLTQLWRVDETGSVGTVDVSFDLTGLGFDMSNAGNFALLTSTGATFSSGAAITAGRSISGNVVTFTGVTLTKGQYFDLAILQSKPVAFLRSITSDTGPSATDFVTSDQTLVFHGTATPHSSVALKTGTTLLATLTAAADSSWSYDNTAMTLADASYSITTTATLDGITGTASAQTIKVDHIAPATPSAPTAPTLHNGFSQTGSYTTTGTAEASSTVNIYDNGVLIGTVTATASGTYSYTASLPDGAHSLTATATDLAGNTSASSSATAFAVDSTPPAAPSAPAVPGLHDGYSQTGHFAATGTAEPLSTVTIYDNGVVIGTTTADASGNYSYTVSLPDGAHSLTATATDAAGNTSAVSGATGFTVDSTPPAPPSGPAVPDVVNGYIRTGAPTVTGTADPLTSITLYVNGVAEGTTTSDASGNYSFTINPALSDGSYGLAARATDAAGNVSFYSTQTNILVDTHAPDAPSAPAVPGLTNGYSRTGALTATGTAEPLSVVTIYDNGVAIGTTTADASGNYSYTASLTDGAHSLTATATDAAGNVSPASGATSFTVDTSAPAAPSTPAVPSITNGYIKTGAPTITGTAEPNSTVTIYDNGVAIGTTTADASGNYSYTASLTDGAHSLTATATDAAGNVSAASGATSFTVDTTVPAAPSAPAVPGIANGYIKTGAPTVTGTAEPNSTVTIYDNGVAIGTTTADASGNYSYTASLTDGAHSLTATATDAAGNVSPASGATSFTVDTTVPAAPSAPAVPGITNGYIKTGAPTITGTAEPNSTVTIYDNGVAIGTTTADASGNYSFTASLTDGAHSLTATSTDAAGNISPAGSATGFTVDTSTPSTPSVPAVPGLTNGYSKTGNVTVTGTAEPGSTITIYDNGVAIGTTTADASGNYSYTASLGDGSHSLSATSTDAAGNVSPASGGAAFTVQAEAPAVTLTAPSATVTTLFTATISFSQPVTGFDMNGVSATNATLSNFVQVNDTVYTVVVTPAGGGGQVSLSVAANVAINQAGTGNLASNVLDLNATITELVDKVYPVPAKTVLHIHFAGIPPTEGRIMLIDMAGQRVYDQQAAISSEEMTINVSEFSSGVYVLKVIAGDYNYQRKIIIQHQ